MKRILFGWMLNDRVLDGAGIVPSIEGIQNPRDVELVLYTFTIVHLYRSKETDKSWRGRSNA